MEPIFRQKYEISAIHVDCFGRVKPSVLLFFAQEAAGGHCEILRLDWETLAKRNLFWAVIRNRMQITRLPVLGETITVETWPMPTTRVAYPRALVACDAQGNELFRSVSLWVLMDLESRAMVLPGKSGVDVGGTLTGSELSVPHSLAPKELKNTATRTVSYTCLDRNGHMNNTRYLDWVSDLLDSAFHKDHTPKELVICYASEALENQVLTLEWDLSEDGILQVDAHRENTLVPDKKHRVFSAQVLF